MKDEEQEYDKEKRDFQETLTDWLWIFGVCIAYAVLFYLINSLEIGGNNLEFPLAF